MKTKILLGISLLFAFNAAFGQGTAFTYQGRLNDGGAPAHGSYDFRFKLFEDPDGNAQAGPTLLTNGYSLTNGLIMATLDFGPGFFNGSNYWLEVDVRTNGGGGYSNLTPLQPVLPTPYAIFANTASNVSGTISSLSLSGAYGNPVVFNNSGNSFNGTLSGNGANITNVNAAALNGLSASNFWKTTGNSGTTAGANFVGTTDNQPLELRVNNQRALRLVPDTSTNNSPNVIGGSPVNTIKSGVVGVTIAGGGSAMYAGTPATNVALGDFNTIGGGWANTTGGTNFNTTEATIAGGGRNTASGISSFIGGGAFNLAYNNNAVVAGGLQNRAGYHAAVVSGFGNAADGAETVVVGGDQNSVDTNAFWASIIGGDQNTISAGGVISFIGGGYQNLINGSYSFIGGGSQNTNIAPTATIGGGERNFVGGAADHATIGGGYSNSIAGSDGPVIDTIGGGSLNSIQPDVAYAMIGGGLANVAGSNSLGSAIGGGSTNVIQSGSTNSTIAGGVNNSVQGFAATIGGGFNNTNTADASFVGGGTTNIILVPAHEATIGGGAGNIILGGGRDSTIGGGVGNTNFGPFATIPGGVNNLAGANAFAAGSGALAGNQGSFVWADASGASLSSTNNNSVTMRGAGGFRLFSNPGATLGVYLAPNGSSWSVISDRNAKKNIRAVNYDAVLDKLSEVPVEQWNYKAESDADTPNLGPMAQDFKHAFYPGRDDKSISTLEFDGVEMAAIQGLNQKLQQKDAEIKELQQSVAELRQLVSHLKQTKSP